MIIWPKVNSTPLGQDDPQNITYKSGFPSIRLSTGSKYNYFSRLPEIRDKKANSGEIASRLRANIITK